jgi:Leucine-rich repeat (LRR) protein
MKRFWKTWLAVLLTVFAAAVLTGCDLFVDRSATELSFDDAAQIDIAELQKYGNLRQLDLRNADITADRFDELRAALPECEIFWSVPFGGERIDSQVTRIVLPKVNAEELVLLQYYPNLVEVDATACDCYGALLSKSIEMPDVTFYWTLTIGGVACANTDAVLDLSGKTTGGAETLAETLRYLPGLTSVDLTNTDVTGGEAQTLIALYPNIAFRYTADVFGVEADSDAASLDLSGAAITDESAIAEALDLLPQLREVDLSGQTLSFDTMNALSERFPEVQFTFSFEVLGAEVTNETTQLDLRGQTFTTAEEVAQGLRQLPKLTYCDLCGSGLTNEQMEALMAEFPNVKFVWYVNIGAWQIRTDIEAFSTGNRDSFPNGAGEFTGKGRTSLTNTEAADLRYCTDLVYLDVGHNKLTDLSFLEGLTKLRALIVAINKLPDIASIAKLTNLEYLEMFMNLVTDISPLAGLTKLEYLNCCRNSFTDITPLLGMTQLKMLWIANNRQIEKDDLQKLRDALPDCNICTYAEHSTAEGWRDNDMYREFQAKFGLPVLDD